MSDIDDLSRLLSELSESCSHEFGTAWAPIEKIAGMRVPSSIRRLVEFADLINVRHPDLLAGYELYSLDQIRDAYSEPNRHNSFFSEYTHDKNFELLGNDCIEMYCSDPELEESYLPVKAINLLRFLPIAQLKGDYLVVDLLSISKESIYELMMGYSANLFAPTLRDHIEDLISGISNGAYTIEEDFVDFPVWWFHRNSKNVCA